MENLLIEVEANMNGATVVDRVYNVVKWNILNWNLKPGLRLSEKETAEHLNVSKTPVRESFIRLCREKLIDISPQRGSFVSKIDLKDVEEGLFIRRSLELSVLERAVTELSQESLIKMRQLIDFQQQSVDQKNFMNFLAFDEKFHREVFLGAYMERTWEVINKANIQYKRVRILTLLDINKSDTLIKEHLLLVSALESKDLEKAKRIIVEHLGKLHFEEGILKKRYPGCFI